MTRKSLAQRLTVIEKLAAKGGGYCDELFSMLREIQTGYATTTISLSLRALYRARLLKTSHVISNVSEVWHPPANLVHGFGRANLPYQPMFYCADGELMALKEVGARKGNRVAMLCGTLRDPNNMPHIFTIGELIKRYRTKKGSMGNQIDHVVDRIRSHPGIDLDRALMVDGFFAKAFKSRGVKSYPLTTAIAQNYLYPEMIDGLSYPSVAAGTGFNLVLKPSSANRLIKPHWVSIIHLENTIRNTFKARVEHVSKEIKINGEIVWG